MHTQHSADTIAAALSFIPANLPRDEWARVGMSIKSEFNDETGFDLFSAWSSTAANYSPKDCRDSWKSFKAAGGVGIGTLLHVAKTYGFTLPKPDQAAPRPTAEALAQREREAAEAREREAQAERARHEAAAIAAREEWDGAAQSGASDYLRRKGVAAHGLRFAPGGLVLVPLRDGKGLLWNVQRISPDGEKRFLPGARKSGCFHLVGTTDAAPAVVLIGEGYATAATVYEACNLPTACAFDAGNLQHVARALRQLYPNALLVIAGDDDAATQAKTGRNPGREKAQAAAAEVGGLAVFPQGLPDGCSDFNDLGGAHGLEAVQVCILGAIQAHQQAAHTPAAKTKGNHSPRTPTRPSGAPTAAGGQGGGRGGDGAGGGIVAPTGGDMDRFVVSDEGVFYFGVDRDGEPTKPEWVCSRLDVVSFTRDQDGGGWGYLLTFADPLGNAKTWPMPARMLAGDGNEYRSYLLSQGLRISTAQRARNLLTMYLQSRRPHTFTTCTDRTGWHGTAFVLPRETVGDNAGERIVFQSDAALENTFTQRGTLQQWQEHVGALCVGNSRLGFAVACAFAAPLLRAVGVESGGFHYRGGSSTGKTTALRVACSVNGGPGYLQRWRSTDNALEATAAQHCDALLVLDELAQIDPKIAGETAYMLANEQSKARATRNGAPRPRLSWRLLYLSAGELGLADHMAEGMKRVRAGQEVRLVDVPADAGAGLGMLQALHGIEGGAAFSRQIVEAAARYYGAPGRAWLQWLTDNADTLRDTVRSQMQAFAQELIPANAGGQVQRVGLRFALVGVAGELATRAGITGWGECEAEWAARECFNAWLSTRGGTGDGEVATMLRQVRAFLEQHGEGRFAWWHRSADDHAAKTLARVGYRRMVDAEGRPIKTDADHLREYGPRMTSDEAAGVSVEFFIMAEAFKAEVCKGLDPAAVSAVLLQHGCLIPEKGRTYDCKPRLPGLGPTRCYRIPAAIFAMDS